MINPWINLPNSPCYILESDKSEIIKFNNNCREDYMLHVELLPEPFLGNPNADIILLNLNPGYDTKDILFHQNNNIFIEGGRINLVHGISEYPFYLLNPNISESPGHKWWSTKLKPLIDIYGLKKIANNVCCIEYFPYHSKKFKKPKEIIPSQNYNFYLVKKAIKRGAIIIIMRSKKMWIEAIPELEKSNYHSLNSSLNVIVSKKNLINGFDEIVKKLKEL